MNRQGSLWRWLATVLGLLLYFSAQAAIPRSIHIQAFLTDQTGAAVASATPSMEFCLYTVPTGGIALWCDVRAVTVEQGALDVDLDESTTPFPAHLFDTPLYLGINVAADGEMTPRIVLGSDAYAFKADDADSVGGRSAASLDQSAHVADLANPHAVTAAQIGAASVADIGVRIDQHTADASAHHSRYSDGEAVASMGSEAATNPLNHSKTTSFTELTDQISDGQVPANIARDNELTWLNLGGIPSGFADGIDNDAGGDITAVVAGSGLVGGGDTGQVTLGLAVPLDLSGSTPATQAIIKATNTNGYGLYGWSSTNYGVYGYSGSGTGMLAYSGSGSGIEGLNGRSGNAGYLGTPLRGVKGIAASASGYGVEGKHSGSGNAGFLGGVDAGIVGISGSSGGYAALFSGKVGVQGDLSTLGRIAIGFTGTASEALDVSGRTRISSTDPQLILNDTDGAGVRPRIRFLNNSGNFDSDDRANQYFGFYSIFSNTRQNDALLRVYGNSSNSWGNYLEFTHDGSDGRVRTDAGNLLLLPAGKVGVGRTAPLATMDIAGGNWNLTAGEGDWRVGTDAYRLKVGVAVDGGGAGNVRMRAQGGTNQLILGSNTSDILTIKPTGVAINGTLTWTTKTGYAAIHPAAFRPRTPGNQHTLFEFGLVNEDLLTHEFIAPIQLPHGATVTRFTLLWGDSNSSLNISAKLRRETIAAPMITMAALSSNDGGGHSSTTTTISSPTVDNQNYSYYIWVNMPSSGPDLILYGAKVEYTYNGP